ncbi:hypothetical protein [Massilia horti]|uniref:PEP-CTERM protein-sorting domain-containing protein n=1 Tax=Massilia horti TaxID=2562153 RepID=A0A4Y9SR53_9BURK|nr:hypothetical protein [Massilia horti]TFW28945.1 hypothetical protein E4O92_20155 [Massilia horti]
MSIAKAVVVAGAVLGLTNVAHAQSLIGSQVTGAIYCCEAPTEQFRATNFVTATVGNQVEFPNGVFSSIVPGLAPVPADLDIGANTIDLHYLASAPAAPGVFDGYVLTFQNAPEILSVKLDSSSTLTPTSISFTGNSVLINNADLALTPQSRVLLNVAVVPEPQEVAMMLGGLVALGMLARGRQQRSRLPEESA